MSVRAIEPPSESLVAAEAAELRYVTDDCPGIRRRGTAPDFVYVRPDGRRITDPDTLARLRSIAVPPAWTEVWICPDTDGHVQATGRDAKGRKQYRYHARWRAVRDDAKFGRLVAFGSALPAVRARVEADLAVVGLSREKVVATVVRLLEWTLVRVGNAEYATSNHSYGLTTLLDDHVAVRGSRIHIAFRGKSGVAHERELADRRLARIVKRCQELPGQDLFQYVDSTASSTRSAPPT